MPTRSATSWWSVGAAASESAHRARPAARPGAAAPAGRSAGGDRRDLRGVRSGPGNGTVRPSVPPGQRERQVGSADDGRFTAQLGGLPPGRPYAMILSSAGSSLTVDEVFGGVPQGLIAMAHVWYHHGAVEFPAESHRRRVAVAGGRPAHRRRPVGPGRKRSTATVYTRRVRRLAASSISAMRLATSGRIRRHGTRCRNSSAGCRKSFRAAPWLAPSTWNPTTVPISTAPRSPSSRRAWPRMRPPGAWRPPGQADDPAAGAVLSQRRAAH
jgi:hypothetical protein